ncbi:hypothetical protein DYB34_004928 [Aphanomyces astaci]|uniref:GH16 domain-containing protein n=1 Tax=Aphanomyces astaci TaxID=112090 RepID=A0A418BS57_APHAT|nr:hypothetical protein DYB34_004928 [Aphanomyces astaci]
MQVVYLLLTLGLAPSVVHADCDADVTTANAVTLTQACTDDLQGGTPPTFETVFADYRTNANSIYMYGLCGSATCNAEITASTYTTCSPATSVTSYSAEIAGFTAACAALSSGITGTCTESNIADNQWAKNLVNLDVACATALNKTPGTGWYTNAFSLLDITTANTITTNYCWSTDCVALATSTKATLASCTDAAGKNLFTDIGDVINHCVGSTGNALYFTHLGNRMASTTPFDLKGIDAQLSFAYIYGHLPNESYDGYGNNTLSCEQVQPGAEVSVEISRDNGTTWQPLVTIPLSGVTATMDVGSNGVLRALACGRGLVGSEILQTCPSFGVVSEVWALDMSGVQAAVAASPALPYADLWRASLNQERTVPYVQFSFGPSITDTQVHSFVLQWNRTAGRANVYRDGQLIRKLRALPASPDPAPLTFHSWVPNAWAGEPRFDSCSTQVSNVQVVKLETAANRWCDWEDAVGGGGGVECDSDATCSQWMTTACLMPVASAVCVNNTCVFGLHPQFASPAVKAASAFHMTISNTHGIQIHVRMDHEQPDAGKRVKKPAKKQPQPLDNFAAAFAAKSMEERIQAHKKSMLLAFESIELVDDDDGLPQFSLDFQGVDLNGGGIPGFEVERASAISLTWFIPHILLSIDLSFANLTDVGCYPIAT